MCPCHNVQHFKFLSQFEHSSKFHFLFLFRFPKKKSFSCPFTLTAEGKVIADRRRKGAHKLWCNPNNAIHRDMWWCKVIHGYRQDWVQFFCFMKKFKMRAYHFTKINNPNINQRTEKRPQYLGMEIQLMAQTDTKICGWLMRKLCYEAFLSGMAFRHITVGFLSI